MGVPKIQLNNEGFASLVLFQFGAKVLGIEIPSHQDIVSNLIECVAKEKPINYIKNDTKYSFKDVIKIAEQYIFDETKKMLYTDNKVNRNFINSLHCEFDVDEVFWEIIKTIFDANYMEEIFADDLYRALYAYGRVIEWDKVRFDKNSTVYKIHRMIKKAVMEYANNS